MIEKTKYEKLKEKYGSTSSWAIWAMPTDSPKSNTSDMSVFKDPDLLNNLNPNYVFVGLNGSSTHGNRKDDETIWTNFHSSYAYQNDYKLRYALMNTKYWGSYITDVIKHYPEVDSGKVANYLNAHPGIVKTNIEDFEKEISLLGTKPILVAMGGKSYDILNTWLGNKYKIVKITHYSFTIGKEDYRKAVLNVLDKT